MKNTSIGSEDNIEGMFSNIKCGQMRQKVISHQESKEDKIIDHSLAIEMHGEVRIKVEIDVFS